MLYYARTVQYICNGGFLADMEMGIGGEEGMFLCYLVHECILCFAVVLKFTFIDALIFCSAEGPTEVCKFCI